MGRKENSMHRKYAPELTYAKMKNGKGISINNVVKAAIKEIKARAIVRAHFKLHFT